MFAQTKFEHLTLGEVEAAHRRISTYVHETPVMTCSKLDEMSDLKLFFKCENLQKTGSFKARGACNAILKATQSNKVPPSHVITHSSGNHGQAVAWAASTVSRIPCSVVVPVGTAVAKCDAIRGYGAKLVFCEPSPTAREEASQKIAKETGGVILAPDDNYDVTEGQATIGYELHNQVSDLDAILVSCAGGALIAGIAMATKVMNPNCKVIAVEPLGKDLGLSLRAKRRLWSDPPRFLDTVAESIRLEQVGELTFPLLCDLVEPDVMTVNDSEMLSATKLVFERMKLVVEPAAGAAVAAALKLKQDSRFQNVKLEKVGVILCGGNVDMDKLPWN